MALSLKQQRFIAAYLGEARGNATEAARSAGYSDPEVSGFDCKRNPAIAARVQERLETETLSSAEVLAELTGIARSEWKHFIQIKTDSAGSVLDAKIVLADKVKALELLGKYYKLFTDRSEVSGPGGGALRIDQTVASLSGEELTERARRILNARLAATDPGGTAGRGD